MLGYFKPKKRASRGEVGDGALGEGEPEGQDEGRVSGGSQGTSKGEEAALRGHRLQGSCARAD